MNPSTSCPSSERVVALAEGTLPPRDAAGVLDHAATCPACFRRIEAAHRLRREIPEGERFDLSASDLEALRRRAPDEALATPARRALRPWMRLAAAAAVAVLVTAAGLRLFDARAGLSREDEVFRGAARTPEILAPRANEILEAPPGQVEWRGPEGSTSFRVRIRASDFSPIWSATLPGPPGVLPEDVRARLAPGGSFYVEVGALFGLQEASEVAIARFEIRPPR
jgi:hypothetical protein